MSGAPDWARERASVATTIPDWAAPADRDSAAAIAPAGDAVGISNAAKSDERARRNLGPLDAEGKRDFGQLWERARQTLADDPQAGNRLADDLVQSPRALNAEESAVLIQHGADLNNRYDRALKDIDEAQKSGDAGAEADAQVRRRELEEQLSAHDQAARQSGYEQGLGLSIRQAMAKRDYSMARQVARFRAIEGGDIPEGTRANLERMTKQIADLNEQIRQRDEQTSKQAVTTRATRPMPQTLLQQHEQLKADLARLLGETPPPSNIRPDVATPPRAADTSSVNPARAEANQIETAARAAATHPEAEKQATPAQQEAGNFKAGHVRIHGLDVTIEVPKGGKRRGIDKNGNAWEREVSDHYGYIKRSEGADGEQFDVYLGPHAHDQNAKVFVIDQNRPNTNRFDESKAMVGFSDGVAARRSYDANFPKGLKVFRGIREMSMDQFKDWVKTGNTKRPLSEQMAAGSRQHRPTSTKCHSRTAFQSAVALVSRKCIVSPAESLAWTPTRRTSEW